MWLFRSNKPVIVYVKGIIIPDELTIVANNSSFVHLQDLC